MNPEVFLEQEDIPSITKALSQVFTRVKPLAILEAAGIDNNFIGNLSLNAQPNMFALELVAAFRTYSISRERLDYHPMIKLFQHLCALAATYKLTDEDRALFSKLIERGKENFQALAACSAVGRIESPQNKGIGTGVLVGGNLLLTCNHIFSKTQVKQAWVRFNFKTGKFPLDIDLFKLDLNFLKHSHRQDFALVKIQGEIQQKIINPNNTPLEREQSIRLIHHPQGKPIEISEEGKITQVGEDYLYHNLKTAEGSSGAPIVNRQWQLIGIHRGNPEINQGRLIVSEIMEGIPLHAFWEKILPLLA